MDCSVERNFNLLKEDPEKLIFFIDKYVRVQLIKNSSFLGYLHSIDPISFSVILSVPQGDAYKIVLIPGHAIVDIAETNPLTNASPPIRKSVTSQSVHEIELKKTKIIAWLKINLLPATEDGENILFGNSRLLPPYEVSDICTDNPMVAMQMRKLIEAMPVDFNPNTQPHPQKDNEVSL